jgi:uncharacterized protein (DUF2164 family)
LASRLAPGTLGSGNDPSVEGSEMSIELEKETEQRIVASIKRYFEEELESQIGDLKATLLLRYVLKEIGPTLYNLAIADVKKHLRDVVDEIDGVCFEPEFGYWKR